jgi:hypothetical protein
VLIASLKKELKEVVVGLYPILARRARLRCRIEGLIAILSAFINAIFQDNALGFYVDNGVAFALHVIIP